jgi:hypothetical protein
MTDTKHSPAPWKVHEDLPCRIIKESHGRLRDYVEIGRAICEDVGDQTAMANAKVIAAAPEMYEAAEKLLELDCWNASCCPFHRIQDCESCAMRKLQHAVNKVKGETT